MIKQKNRNAKPLIYRLALIVCIFTLPAFSSATTHPSQQTRPILLTAKERLGHKYADNQRVNNCKVPKELRGKKHRPADCKHGQSMLMLKLPSQ